MLWTRMLLGPALILDSSVVLAVPVLFVVSVLFSEAETGGFAWLTGWVVAISVAAASSSFMLWRAKLANKRVGALAFRLTIAQLALAGVGLVLTPLAFAYAVAALLKLLVAQELAK